MSRYIATESAIAFMGTEHEHQIVDQETREAYERSMDQSQVDVFMEAGEVTGVTDALADTLNDTRSNPVDAFDEDYDASRSSVEALESMIADLEGVDLPKPENVPEDAPDVEYDVTVELDESSKQEFDADIKDIISTEPELCESLESIILCDERSVGTLLSILRNKVAELKGM